MVHKRRSSLWLPPLPAPPPRTRTRTRTGCPYLLVQAPSLGFGSSLLLPRLSRRFLKLLQLLRLLLRHGDHGGGEGRQLGHVDPEALVTDACNHQERRWYRARQAPPTPARPLTWAEPVEHGQRVVGGQRRHVQVVDGRLRRRQRRQLVEVRGEEAEAADGGGDVAADGPRQAEAVVGGGAAAQLVDDDERVGGGGAAGGEEREPGTCT